MEQLDFFDVPSPCIGVCSSDERGYCKGCMRNRDERFEWQTMSPNKKKHVIKLCRQRYRRKMLNNPSSPKTTVTEPTNPQADLFD
ncbi:DUF1289 domain-containing protein [Vibrio superstes]|uniref:DUF1289 domain-containing protein n=1 Tax=Vibrio superstes NBRC 103154 TaxID=1219062 RepID=A0A511QQ99_9VIBR|nr:DUF1289 domain-containing protein [Vibrio superstes]GEM79518.1 DUF1289 domain-containing protein [Vibrio superstes NBRC 103154]